MITGYKPNQYSKMYRRLPRNKRDQVNRQTNVLFAKRTGVNRKLHPERDRALALVWLHCRDEIMASTSRTSTSPQNLGATTQRAAGELFEWMSDGVRSAFEPVENRQIMPWMPIARAEERKNVTEKAGEGTDTNVMKYLRASDDRYATKAKANYTEKHGGEKVKWCSAFVNWCMEEAKIPGTNNARALSWSSWGERLKEPQVGAIVVLKNEKIIGKKKVVNWRHVAFIDYKNGKYVMLGGNQRPAGGGASNSVSYRPYKKSNVVSYRWPSGRPRPQL